MFRSFLLPAMAMVFCGGCGYVWEEIARSEASPAVESPSRFLAAERESLSLPPVHGLTGTVGLRFGTQTFAMDDASDWFDPGLYFGLEVGWETSLRTGVVASVGYLSIPSVAGGSGVDDYVAIPVRASFEFKDLMLHSLSRWFVGVGGGYMILQDEIAALPPAPELVSEPTAHFAAGIEFRDYGPMTLRIEGAYTFGLETEGRIRSLTGTLAYGF